MHSWVSKPQTLTLRNAAECEGLACETSKRPGACLFRVYMNGECPGPTPGYGKVTKLWIDQANCQLCHQFLHTVWYNVMVSTQVVKIGSHIWWSAHGDTIIMVYKINVLIVLYIAVHCIILFDLFPSTPLPWPSVLFITKTYDHNLEINHWFLKLSHIL